MYRSKYNGKFRPKFPQKYKGDCTNIVFRSLLERAFMMYLDRNPMVLEWGSEEFCIQYTNPLDGSKHRYFPDMFVVAKDAKGDIKRILVEIKPEKQTIEPEIQTKKTKKYLLEVTTWVTNQAKWNAAKEWCRRNNAEFRIITDKDINGKRRKPHRR